MKNIGNRQVDYVMSLFGIARKAKPMGQRPRARAAPDAHVPADRQELQDAGPVMDDPSFEERLAEFAAGRDTAQNLVAGKVHLINLDKVRQRIGDKWPKVAERVNTLIRTELNQRLTPHDMFSQVNADTYVVVFGDCSDVEARLKIALLSEKILERIFGETDSKDLQALGVESVVTQADGKIAHNALKSTASLVALLERAELTQLDPNTHKYKATAEERALGPEAVSTLLGDVDGEISNCEQADSSDGKPRIRVDRLRGLMRQLEQLEETIAAEDPLAKSTATQGKESTSAEWIAFRRPQIELIDSLKQRAEQHIAYVYGQPPAADGESLDAEEELALDYSYTPMWHAPSQRVGIYLCETNISLPGEVPAGSDVDLSDFEADLRAVVDRLTLRRARQDLCTTYEQGRLNVVAVPIHLTTLQRHSSWRRIIELCSNIPTEARKLIIWELQGAQVASWTMQLGEATKSIRHYGRAVFLRLPDPQDNFRDIMRNLRSLSAAGIHEIGINVADLEGTEAQRLALMEKLAVEAQKSGLKCYALGFNSLSMTVNAVCLGYQHVCGPAVAASVKRPDGIHATAMEALYARLVARLTSGDGTSPAK